jgi:hypothetical protein
MDPVTPDADQPMPGAKAPVGTGLSPLWALLMALILVGLGVLLIQDALARSGMLEQTSWTRNPAEAADGTDRPGWVWPAIPVLVVLGVVLAVLVLKPRPRRGLVLAAAPRGYPGAGLSRMVDNLLVEVEGVADVTSRITGGKLQVAVSTLAPESEDELLEAELRTRLEPLLATLRSPLRVDISIHNEEV